MPAMKQHLNQLRRMGTTQVAHRNGTLYEHLTGVWVLLKDWNNPEAICLAGLYHSIYGTGGFEQRLVSIDKRQSIIDLIGYEAERFVYLFAACDRPVTHPRIGQDNPPLFHDRFSQKDYPLHASEWRALCEIMLANELNLGQHNTAFYKKHLTHYQDLFTRFEPWLSNSAILARYELEQQLRA
jgi:hypothetical protein